MEMWIGIKYLLSVLDSMIKQEQSNIESRKEYISGLNAIVNYLKVYERRIK